MINNQSNSIQSKKKLGHDYKRLNAKFRQHIKTQEEYDNRKTGLLVSLLTAEKPNSNISKGDIKNYDKHNNIVVEKQSPNGSQAASVAIEKIPPQIDKTFTDFKVNHDSQQLTMNALLNWRPGQKGYLIYGTCGAGKTHLLKSFYYRLCKSKSLSGKSILYYKAASLSLDLLDRDSIAFTKTDTVSIEMPKHKCVIHDAMNADILFIEDLGTEYNSEFVKSRIHMIMDKRYEDNKTTFIDSNLSMKELSDRYGEHVADRAKGIAKPILCTSEKSYRGREWEGLSK